MAKRAKKPAIPLPDGHVVMVVKDGNFIGKICDDFLITTPEEYDQLNEEISQIGYDILSACDARKRAEGVL